MIPLKLTKDYFFIFVCFYAVAMPFFNKQIGSAGVLVVNGAIILFISVYLLVENGLVIPFSDRIHKKIALLFLFPISFFMILTPLSMSIGLYFGGVSVVERDFFELYRPVLYFLVFLFSYLYFTGEKRIFHFEKILLYIFLVLVVLGLNHYFRVFDNISELYTKSHNIKTRRVAVPFVNPYDYAFFMLFFVYYFFMKFLFHRSYYIVFFMFSVVMFVLPQSRSVAAGSLVGFFVIIPIVLTYTGFNIKKFKIKSKLMTFYSFLLCVVVGFIASIPLLIENFPYLTGQFIRLLESGDVGGSAGTRIEQFLFALNKAGSSPWIMFFGNGPAKDEMEFVESIYNYFFYRYGLIGTFLYFYILSLACYLSFKLVGYYGYKNTNFGLLFSILVFFLTIPILSIGNNFTEQARISFFYYVFLGLIAASYYRATLKGLK